MSAYLSPVPVLRFFDANGLPLVGGKVYTYVAGTTTPLASYTDSTGSVAHTNPIILDANGECSLWLDSTSTYKINVLDADNVQQPNWPQDNIQSVGMLVEQSVDTIKDLLGDSSDIANGDALIKVKQPLTGAAAITQHAKNQDFICATDFVGVDPTGAVDSTTGLRAALASGRSIYLGGYDKTYSISDTLGQLSVGQWLFADGATIVTSSNTAIISHNDNTHIEGVVFKGSGKSSGSTSQVGVSIVGDGSFVGPSRSITQSCKFIDMGGAGVKIGNVVESHEGNLLLGIIYESCNIGLDVGERGEYTQIMGGSATLCNTGVKITGGNTNLGGMTVCDNTTGIHVAAGGNDSHGQVFGFSANHNTNNVRVDNINTQSFTFGNGSIFIGNIWLNECKGVRFNGIEIGLITILEEGATNCSFQNCKFTVTPTITNNYNSKPSEVFYLDCFWPDSISCSSSYRINGAYSGVAQTSSYPTITTGTTHDYGFPNITANVISANTAYSVKTLYNTAGKYWDFTVLNTSIANIFATIVANLTVYKIGGALDDTKIDVWLYDVTTSDRLGGFTKGPDQTSGSDHYRIYSFNGQVPKGSGKIGIRIRNDTGGSIVVLNNATGTPTSAVATGW